MSSRIRPAPRVPSKQVKANTLPDTNLRASSAFICPANTGAVIAPAVMAPNTKRANICNSDLPSAGKGLRSFTCCLPYQPWQHWSSLVGKVGTPLQNFYHDSTADLADEDFAAVGDNFAETDFVSDFSKF